MAEKFGPIYEAMMKKNVVAYDTGDVDGAAEMYDDHGVVVDKKENKSYFGLEQIKQMIDGFIKMGKVEFKTSRKDFHDVGDGRFFVDADFETTFVESGVVMKGNFHQLFHKKGDQYKCVYEVYSMQ
ncbi:hypothetical protein PRIPAC_85476 [Pristionchus pacificus]|uniref:Uncharacterized protein n=1 Tax=Pristionchus pacificus TaxID=54126 RepID=A0A2A6BUG5_PRIPA|nr:hypothetical protein PRIPAC_85476 [Pristionchus pacificus]|eukprot:PDM69560.1 hypothetical protein PRIPAC_44656 [Pristionchus pacificus]